MKSVLTWKMAPHNLQEADLRELLHDLRSPLAAIEGIALLAIRSRQEGAGDQVERWSSVLGATDDMYRLVENALISGASSTFRCGDTKSFDVAQLIRKIEGQWISKFRVAGVHLETRLSFSECVVTGSLLLLQRAITNLVENALAHAVRGDLVVLSAEPSSYCVLTAVANVHAGLTQDEANSFSEVGTGEPWAGIKFGIGLTAARRIAEKLGGRMEIESQIGRAHV